MSGPSQIVRSLLIALLITSILTLIEVGVLLLINPMHVGSFSGRLTALLIMPVRMPQVLLVPGVELVIGFFAVFLGMKPWELMAYLRDAHRAQEESHTLYTPLTALTNVRQAPDAYQSESSPQIATREVQVSILDLVQQQDTHQMILGVPGAGKTMALRVYQYIASQQPLKLVMSGGHIPIYVPMKNYSLFLKKYVPVDGNGHESQEVLSLNLLDYLYESDLPGMRHLRPYLGELYQQGRLMLLCDGLNEIDSNYFARVSAELVAMMRGSGNRLVMTCWEVDYREQYDFVQLVNDGHASRAVIYPLLPEQVHEFVERYIERQDRNWQHTAGQIIQVIDRSRLRYHCTNPMMLFTLMGIIDTLGVERGKHIDTRGRLLRESVRQLIAYEQRQAKWGKAAPSAREVITFLSEVACAARWANDRNAIQLRISTQSATRPDITELSDELQFWLDEHPAREPFATEDQAHSDPYSDIAQLLQFALSAQLIEISQGGVLSFRHELIAEYFVAEYFFAATNTQVSAPLREELLENVGRWSEPVAIWAGLLNNPLALAECFGVIGHSNPAYVLPALALGLVCVGVLWMPPQAENPQPVLLPSSMEEALALAVRSKAAREELARIFTRCAEEGGHEVYRSLLPLIMVEGVDELLTLLDQNIVPELLFTHLQDTVDNVAYEAQVKRLTRVLGRFGSAVVERALQLSQPQPDRSVRLRAAAINILGGTMAPLAVEPLIERLGDSEPFIVERATNALIRLGSELTLSRLLQELENRTPRPFAARIHRAIVLILKRFLEEQDLRRQLTLMQYQRVLDSLVPVLTSNYQSEPDVQQLVCSILAQQAGETIGASARDHRWEKVIETLLRYLPSHDDLAAQHVILTLQEIGPAATPRLLDQLNPANELVRIRVVEILAVIRDPRALPRLLRLLADPPPAVQQQVAHALKIYAPESIAGLIDLVFTGHDTLAERAAHILASIGEAVVVPVMNVLFHVVPGRTRLLVRVLEQVHDERAVPTLITLLQTPQIESLLAVTIIRALSRFGDKRAVQPLLAQLAASSPQLYEEAIDALSQLGPAALEGLIATLDNQGEPQEALIVPRVRRAILGMVPFPGDELVRALERVNREQAQQILAVFKMQGSEAAQVLVRHLLHRDEHVREYVFQALNEMPGSVVVPALLEVLHLPSLRKVTNTLLLKHPDAAISPLVELLGEHERGDAAALLLPEFGPRVLKPLISGLDDPRSMAREHAQRIMVALVRRSEDPQSVLRELVRLFYQSLPLRAREVLLEVLSNELVDVSIPAMLEGLEDAHLIDDVAEAFVRLSRKETWQAIVLDQLIQNLSLAERRRGAEAALVRISAPAVPRVGELISSQQQAIASSAKRILREIGVPALAFIWSAHSDKSNPARREAALEVFHMMRTEVIKDELIGRLLSDKPDDISMAVTLLLERIRAEASQHYADRVMIPELIDYVQVHGVDRTNLRVLALLLMLGEHAILDHLLQTLDDHPQHRRQLTNIFLLLGSETQVALLQSFQDAQTSVELRAEIASVLGMMSAPEVIAEYAQNIGNYGTSSTIANVMFPEHLVVALRALGGLLAGGHWNIRRLQELRDASLEGSPARELFNVLLGWRYEPQIARLESDLQSLRNEYKKQLLTLTAQMAEARKHSQSLEDEMEDLRREHSEKSDELHQTSRDVHVLRSNLDQTHQQNEQLIRELEAAQVALEKTQKERDSALVSLHQVQKDRDTIKARLQQALQE